MSLTHTPAHTHEYPDRFVNEATGWGYSVRQDTEADDPRDDLPNVMALWAYSEPRNGSSVAGIPPEDNVAIDAFARYWDQYDADTSLALTQRYLAAFHPEKKISVAIKTIRGYSQSDWLDVVCAVEDGYGSPESHIDEFRQWAFGDVWAVIPDGKPGISNIYADSVEEALSYFRENFEDHAPTPTCDRHGGPWGSDETCQRCTDINGDPCMTPLITEGHWDNDLPAAMAECMTGREDPKTDRAIAWLKRHESSDEVWTAINELFDRIEQLAADNEK